MESYQTDWFLVVSAAILNMVIGFVWYSKWLFGPIWLKLSGLKERELKNPKRCMLCGFIVSLLTAYLLSFFEGHLGVVSVSDGMFVGLLLWLGFSATTEISGVIWCNKPFKFFIVNSGYKLVSFLVMSGVIAA